MVALVASPKLLHFGGQQLAPMQTSAPRAAAAWQGSYVTAKINSGGASGNYPAHITLNRSTTSATTTAAAQPPLSTVATGNPAAILPQLATVNPAATTSVPGHTGTLDGTALTRPTIGAQAQAQAQARARAIAEHTATTAATATTFAAESRHTATATQPTASYAATTISTGSASMTQSDMGGDVTPATTATPTSFPGADHESTLSTSPRNSPPPFLSVRAAPAAEATSSATSSQNARPSLISTVPAHNKCAALKQAPGPDLNPDPDYSPVHARSTLARPKAKLHSFVSFESARTFSRTLGLAGARRWYAWCKTGARPSHVPFSPDRTYKHEGWQGWEHFLGTEGQPRHVTARVTDPARLVKKNVVPSSQASIHAPNQPSSSKLGNTSVSFNAALVFARGLGLKGARQWYAWCKTESRPAMVPFSPDRTYKNDGWQGWDHWLTRQVPSFREGCLSLQLFGCCHGTLPFVVVRVVVLWRPWLPGHTQSGRSFVYCAVAFVLQTTVACHTYVLLPRPSLGIVQASSMAGTSCCTKHSHTGSKLFRSGIGWYCRPPGPLDTIWHTAHRAFANS